MSQLKEVDVLDFTLNEDMVHTDIEVDMHDIAGRTTRVTGKYLAYQPLPVTDFDVTLNEVPMTTSIDGHKGTGWCEFQWDNRYLEHMKKIQNSAPLAARARSTEQGDFQKGNHPQNNKAEPDWRPTMTRSEMPATGDLRQSPTDEFIAELRKRYPTEPEIDRVLTRKMQQRTGEPYSPVSFEQMTDCLHQLLSRELTKPFKVKNARWMTGGSSKLQMMFELEWHGLSGDQALHTTPMVLRMSPAESIVESSRRREFEIISALSDLIPVPQCYWEDEMAEIFPTL
jgi:hypothetical protein